MKGISYGMVSAYILIVVLLIYIVGVGSYGAF